MIITSPAPEEQVGIKEHPQKTILSPPRDKQKSQTEPIKDKENKLTP